MTSCSISPADRRAQAKAVGDYLARQHGKKPFYSVAEVREANRLAGIPLDVCCWSHALFNTHADFDAMHAAAREACDYVLMKSMMLSSLSDAAASSWFDFDLSWLEFPDIDWSIFDFLDFS